MLAEPRLQQTRRAFDALARDYDRSEERNELLLRLRRQMWQELTDLFPPGARLLDLGCGTGIDAVYLAERGYRVVATDLSPAMIARTQERAGAAGVRHLVEALPLAIEDLRLPSTNGTATAHALTSVAETVGRTVVSRPVPPDTGANTASLAQILAMDGADRSPDRLRQPIPFDGIYSNRGPFNCVDNLEEIAHTCAQLLPPGGRLVTTVIGRLCPWEALYYGAHGQAWRALVRTRRGFVSVPLQGQRVPTRYFTPGEFYRSFERDFVLERYRSLLLFLPPTYLAPLMGRFPTASRAAARLDRALAGLPGLRNLGDMFLMVLRRRG